MSQYPSPFGMNRANPLEYAGPESAALVRFFNAVYAWMCVGLAVTATVAYLTSQHIEALFRFGGSSLLILFVVEIALVMVIARAVNKISAGVATGLFVLYAAINGVTLAGIFLVYTHATLASAFVVSAATFGAMSVFGMVTKRDLTGMGRIMMMLLIGLIIASIVSIFWHNSTLQVLMNYVGVLVFVGLTAYDTQKLKMIAEQTQNDSAMAARMSVVGSLVLYLDFINLFLFILQLMGDRRR
jgi:FtsH-binding integral membrane protein